MQETNASIKKKYLMYLKMYDTSLNENLKIIDNFIRDFPISKLKNISLDEYIIWKQNANSFCHRLERWDTLELWSIRWGTAIKFWIYYHSETSTYKYTNKFGSKEEAIKRIWEFLYGVSNSKTLSDLSTIEDSDVLSPMVTRKVFYIYNPEKLIPIFSTNALNDKMNSIFWVKNTTYEEEQEQLLEIYNSVNNANKNTYNFMLFLYDLTNHQSMIDGQETRLNTEKKLGEEFLEKFSDESYINELIKLKTEKRKEEELEVEKEAEAFGNNKTIVSEDDKDKASNRDMREQEFGENMKMKRTAFRVVMSLMWLEIVFIFIIFFLVWINYLNFSDNTLNVFIWATIWEISAIFYWIIKYLFPENNKKD